MRGTMNRVAVWILATISGLLLVYGCLLFSFSADGYGAGSGCVNVEGAPPCTPVLDTVGVSLPPHGPFLVAAGMFVLAAVIIGLPAWIASPLLAARRGASSKTPILVVSLVATALVAVAVYIVLTSPALASPKTCVNNAGCVTGAMAPLVAVLGIGLGPLLTAQLANLPAWVMALVRTSHSRQWRWFVAILLLSPVACAVYGLLGKERDTIAPAVAAA